MKRKDLVRRKSRKAYLKRIDITTSVNPKSRNTKMKEAVEKLHLDPGTSLTRKCLCAVIPEAVVGNPFFLRELGYPPSRV